jgi:hypothetical protein
MHSRSAPFIFVIYIIEALQMIFFLLPSEGLGSAYFGFCEILRILGYLIRPEGKSRRKVKGGFKTVRQSRYGHIHFNVDTRKIIKRLSEKGFCDKKGACAKPNFQYLRFKTVNLSPDYFSSLGTCKKRLNNYYKLANNHLLRRSEGPQAIV